MTNKKIFLGMAIADGYGPLPAAWRAPHVDPGNYAKIEATIRHAQAAERGKFAFLFTPDFPAVRSTIERATLSNTMEPMMTLTAIATQTERIGLAATGSTTFQEPFNLARQFKTLDVMSHGRAAWNAVTTSDPAVAANYGRPVAERTERYQRAHEAVEIVQALWRSWGKDAWLKDQNSGTFIDPSKLQPINMQGSHVASRGPLAVPPSEQGQPVIFTSGGPSPHLLALAGRFASVFISEVWTIEEARHQREAVRNAASEAGRDPDEIKYVAGIMTTIAPTVREALDRRLTLSEEVIPHRVPLLGQMLGLHLDPSQVDEPLSSDQLARAHASPIDPRSERALEVAEEGWTIRDILGHGVIDFHPTTIGPGSVAADHLQAWFEAGAADGFWLSPDIYDDGIDAFVNEVVPILQDRGIYPKEYEGTTLRDHLGIPEQYGVDTRTGNGSAK